MSHVVRFVLVRLECLPRAVWLGDDEHDMVRRCENSVIYRGP